MSSPSGQSLDVLMYHSISSGEGPTCIAPDTFRMQLELLGELGYQSVTLRDVLAWLDGHRPLPPRPVLITFDDGFRDFAQVAWPLLKQLGFGAVVFVPTGHVGGTDVWETGTAAPGRVVTSDCSATPTAATVLAAQAVGDEPDAGRCGSSPPPSPQSARPLMDWAEVVHLGGEGVEFGGHTVHHWNLTRLSAELVQEEITKSKQQLEKRLSGEVLAFAPPFGRSTPAVKAVIAQVYRLSFGTVLARATARSDRWDLPRIEMHYFRRPDRWRTHLMGGGRLWLAARRSLRAVRQAARERFSPSENYSTDFSST